MFDTILSWTQLPNLHPALVHFPIAFVVLALVFEATGTLRGRKEWLDRSATSVWAAAGLGAWAAYWAGERAERSLTVTEPVHEAIELHSDWGHYTLYVVGAIAILRFTLVLWRPAPRDGRLWPGVFLLAAILATGVVLRTADLGGALVYRYGVAVERSTGAPEKGGESPIEP